MSHELETRRRKGRHPDKHGAESSSDQVTPMSGPAPVAGPFGDPRDKPQERGPIRTYINPAGERVKVEMARKNSNGTFDIIVPAGVTTYRRDGVPKKSPERLTDCVD